MSCLHLWFTHSSTSHTHTHAHTYSHTHTHTHTHTQTAVDFMLVMAHGQLSMDTQVKELCIASTWYKSLNLTNTFVRTQTGGVEFSECGATTASLPSHPTLRALAGQEQVVGTL